MDLLLIHLLPGGLTEITEHRGQWNCDDVADDQNIACQRSIRTKNGPTLAGGRRGAGRVSSVWGERGVCDDRPPLTSYSYHWHFDSENLIFMVSLMSSIHASIDMLTALQMQWNSHEISSLQCFVVNLKHAKMLFYWRLSLKISSMTWQFLCMHEKICTQQQYKTW